MKVVITNVPSGKFDIGPRSTSFVSTPSPMNDGSTAKPSDGTTTPTPMRPPRPIVASERNPARPYVSRCCVFRGGEARRRRVAHELVRRRRVDGRMRTRGVANPEQTEGDREQGADDESHDADDEADEDDGNADGEADRPQALARFPWSVVRILGHSLLSIA